MEITNAVTLPSDIRCPKCGGSIKPSGFNGHLFCWGKCYHYLSDEEIKEAKEADLKKSGKII